MSNNNVVEIYNRDTITDVLTDMLRAGAQQLPQKTGNCQIKSEPLQITYITTGGNSQALF